MITAASVAVAVVLGVIVGAVGVSAIISTALGLQFARGLNW